MLQSLFHKQLFIILCLIGFAGLALGQEKPQIKATSDRVFSIYSGDTLHIEVKIKKGTSHQIKWIKDEQIFCRTAKCKILSGSWRTGRHKIMVFVYNEYGSSSAQFRINVLKNPKSRDNRSVTPEIVAFEPSQSQGSGKMQLKSLRGFVYAYNNDQIRLVKENKETLHGDEKVRTENKSAGLIELNDQTEAFLFRKSQIILAFDKVKKNRNAILVEKGVLRYRVKSHVDPDYEHPVLLLDKDLELHPESDADVVVESHKNFYAVAVLRGAATLISHLGEGSEKNKIQTRRDKQLYPGEFIRISKKGEIIDHPISGYKKLTPLVKFSSPWLVDDSANAGGDHGVDQENGDDDSNQQEGQKEDQEEEKRPKKKSNSASKSPSIAMPFSATQLEEKPDELIARGDFIKLLALSHSEYLSQEYSGSKKYYQALGYYKLGFLKHALQVVQENPEQFLYGFDQNILAAFVLSESGKYDEAINYFDEAEVFGEYRNVPYLLKRAQAAYNAGSYLDAKSYYRMLLWMSENSAIEGGARDHLELISYKEWLEFTAGFGLFYGNGIVRASEQFISANEISDLGWGYFGYGAASLKLVSGDYFKLGMKLTNNTIIHSVVRMQGLDRRENGLEIPIEVGFEDELNYRHSVLFKPYALLAKLGDERAADKAGVSLDYFNSYLSRFPFLKLRVEKLVDPRPDIYDSHDMVTREYHGGLDLSHDTQQVQLNYNAFNLGEWEFDLAADHLTREYTADESILLSHAETKLGLRWQLRPYYSLGLKGDLFAGQRSFSEADRADSFFEYDFWVSQHVNSFFKAFMHISGVNNDSDQDDYKYKETRLEIGSEVNF